MSIKNVKPSTYLLEVKALSDRILQAQQPIRILDAIKWDDTIKQEFFKNKCRKLPAVSIDYYRNRPLGFEVAEKKQEFYQIERDLVRKLGQLNPLSVIMRRICREYQDVVYMLEARGTPEFSSISQELYGSSQDVFHVGDPTIANLGSMMEAWPDKWMQEQYQRWFKNDDRFLTMFQYCAADGRGLERHD